MTIFLRGCYLLIDLACYFFLQTSQIFWWSFRPQILTAITDSKRARSRFAIKEVLTQAETNNVCVFKDLENLDPINHVTKGKCKTQHCSFPPKNARKNPGYPYFPCVMEVQRSELGGVARCSKDPPQQWSVCCAIRQWQGWWVEQHEGIWRFFDSETFGRFFFPEQMGIMVTKKRGRSLEHHPSKFGVKRMRHVTMKPRWAT